MTAYVPGAATGNLSFAIHKRGYISVGAQTAPPTRLLDKLARVNNYVVVLTESGERTAPSSFPLDPALATPQARLDPEIAYSIGRRVILWSDSFYTAWQARVPLHERVLDGVLSRAKNEDFEAGYTSQLSLELCDLAHKRGKEMERDLRLALERLDSPAVAAEVLRWIGSSEADLSLKAKARLLKGGLFSPHLIVRDAAALAYGSLNSRVGINALRLAAEREANDELRSDMIAILKDLESLSDAEVLVSGVQA